MSIYIYILYIITLIVIISSLFYIKKYKKKEKFNNIDINIKSYVINLDYRIDRKKKFINDYKLKKIKYEIIKAIDKKNLSALELYKDNILGIFGYNSLNNIIRDFHYEFNDLGAVGCYLSHIKTWNKILEDNVDYGIIYEDDVLFNNYIDDYKIKEYIKNVPKDWDIIIMNKNKVKMKKYKDNIFKVYEFLCLHSYIIKKDSIEYIISNILPINQQIDWKLACLANQNLINIYLFNDITNNEFYRQQVTGTNVQTISKKNASWNLNCNI